MLAIFLDTETTGLDPFKHDVIDIALKIIDLCSGKEVASYQSLIKLSLQKWEKRDPGSMLINGYSWDQISTGKDLLLVGEEIKELFSKFPIERGRAFFVCQNPGFDRAFFGQMVDFYTQDKLNWPYHWLDLASMYWFYVSAQCKKDGIPLPDKINLSKNCIAEAFGILPESEPHQAMNGVNHLISCYFALLNKISDKIS